MRLYRSFQRSFVLAATAVLALVGLSSASTAEANLDFKDKYCNSTVADPEYVDPKQLSCGVLDLPLDYSGSYPGRVELHVAKYKARSRKSSTEEAVVALAGGPGQGASLYVGEFADLLYHGVGQRDLYVPDQRGTGFSEALGCTSLERPIQLQQLPAVGATCAAKLGGAANFYSTAESVEDLERMRQSIGVKRLVLFGVSYGTKVASAYAVKYPNNVSRLVLDSVVLPESIGGMYENSFAATPRLLQDLCKNKRCAGVTDNPADDLEKLISSMGKQPISGQMINRYGKSTAAQVSSMDIFSYLVEGDFDNYLRAAFPGAVKSAVNGDKQPLIREIRRFDRLYNEPISALGRIEFSSALYTATICEDTKFPWLRTATFQERIEQAGSYAQTTNFKPFDGSTALDSFEYLMCQRWPIHSQDRSIAGGPLPNVPTLIVNGESDLRTPLEDAKTLQARIPNAKLVEVEDYGHSVLTGANLASCQRKQLERFFKDKAVTNCKSGSDDPLPPISAVAPFDLKQVPTVGGYKGSRGRTLKAVLLTLDDYENEAFYEFVMQFELGKIYDINLVHSGGLRGGRATFNLNANTVKLKEYEFVPGVKMSGRFSLDSKDRITGSLTVSGASASKGRLKITRNLLTGRLGGKRVRYRIKGRYLSSSSTAGGLVSMSKSDGSTKSRFQPIDWMPLEIAK